MAWWSRVPTLRRMAEPSVRTITDDELGDLHQRRPHRLRRGSGVADEEIEAAASAHRPRPGARRLRRGRPHVRRGPGLRHPAHRARRQHRCRAPRSPASACCPPTAAVATSRRLMRTPARRRGRARRARGRARSPAEYPIYGRYGYGPATEAMHPARRHGRGLVARRRRRRRRARRRRDVRQDRRGALRPGAARPSPGTLLGDRPSGASTPASIRLRGVTATRRKKATRVVWRDAAGEARAATAYQVDGTLGAEPTGRASSRSRCSSPPTVGPSSRCCATSPRSTGCLASRCGCAPSTRSPRSPSSTAGPPSSPTAPTTCGCGCVDVPAALTARTYASDGSLVVEVVDPMGFGTGRFRLEAGPDGATCTTTTEDADLTVPVGALGAAYLGGTGWGRLAAAGWVDEHRAGRGRPRRGAVHRAPRTVVRDHVLSPGVAARPAARSDHPVVAAVDGDLRAGGPGEGRAAESHRRRGHVRRRTSAPSTLRRGTARASGRSRRPARR